MWKKLNKTNKTQKTINLDFWEQACVCMHASMCMHAYMLENADLEQKRIGD